MVKATGKRQITLLGVVVIALGLFQLRSDAWNISSTIHRLAVVQVANRESHDHDDHQKLHDLDDSPAMHRNTQNVSYDDGNKDDVAMEMMVAEDKSNLFVMPDFSLVLDEFKSQDMIIVDYPFHHFVDPYYHLIASKFDQQELLKMLQDVSNIWIKGNIFVRFRKGDVLNPANLSHTAAAAYRWFVSGEKDMNNSAAFRQDFQEMLVKEVGDDMAHKIVHQLYPRKNGHSLLNWILSIGKYEGGKRASFYHIYTIFFYKWNNGGTTKSRIFLRSGSCLRGRVKKYVNGTLVKCKGWVNLTRNRGKMSRKEFIRVLAHEIG